MKKYTHIFFDLDNTLWDFENNSKLAMHVTFQSLDLDKQNVDFETFFRVYKKVNDDLWRAYRENKIKKQELIFQRFNLTFNALGLNNVDPLKMNDLYLSEMPKQSGLVVGAKEILDYLESKQYKLFIITNGFSKVQHDKLESSELKRYFSKVFISEAIKAPKPAKEIFNYAIKSSNARKSSSVMIGDDFQSDILGAVNAGIDAIFYNYGRKEIGAAVVGLDKHYKIVTNLGEIKSLL